MRMRRPGKVNHDRWLVSYADFITLLFAFFVVMFATGESDRAKKVELSASIQSAFREMGVFDARSKFPAVVDAAGGGPDAKNAASGAEREAGPMTLASLTAIEEKLYGVAGAEIASGLIGVHQSREGLVISLEEAGFFDSGVADIRPSALPVFDRIATVLPVTALRVEGHTDDVPIHTAQFASNWELSSARASSVARLLLAHPNVHPELLSVAGYAEFHPAASNATPEGRARNRRVDIVVFAAAP